MFGILDYKGRYTTNTKENTGYLAIQPPEKKQLRKFIGTVNFHKDIVDKEVRDSGSLNKDDIQVGQITMD